MSGIALTINEPLPKEVDAGTRFSLSVAIKAHPECDLRNAPFAIRESDGTTLAGQLGDLTGDEHDTAEIVLTAPERVGEFTWTFALLSREVDGVRYDEASLDFSFNTKLHAMSLAVWGAPSPIPLATLPV